jgi:REP element-mobilizing transposase RayT
MVIHACPILPAHVHMVIARHRFTVEQVVNLLNGNATKWLTRCGLHPMQNQVETGRPLPSPWASGLWKVYLDARADVRRAIEYVHQNPIKEGKRVQEWRFVVPYEDDAKRKPVPLGRR